MAAASGVGMGQPFGKDLPIPPSFSAILSAWNAGNVVDLVPASEEELQGFEPKPGQCHKNVNRFEGLYRPARGWIWNSAPFAVGDDLVGVFAAHSVVIIGARYVDVTLLRGQAPRMVLHSQISTMPFCTDWVHVEHGALGLSK